MQSYKSVKVGGIYETNNFGKLEVMSIDGPKSALVKFLTSGYTTKAELGSIRSGQVKDWYLSMKEWVGKIMPTVNFGGVDMMGASG